LESALIPRASAGKPVREVDLDLALHGGEDYELLFTARPGKRIPSQISGVVLTHIGHITRSRIILVRNFKGIAYELEPRGWEHFRQ
jgi:thiamine-monophosphate kinase